MGGLRGPTPPPLVQVITIALTVPMFRSYRLHTIFQIFKVAASIWHGECIVLYPSVL